MLAEGWGQAEAAADRLAGARRVFVTGVGTSYHASLMGGWLLRAAGELSLNEIAIVTRSSVAAVKMRLPCSVEADRVTQGVA